MTFDTGALTSIAIFLLMQTGALVYFAGRTTARLDAIERWLDSLAREQRDCPVRRFGSHGILPS